MHPTYEPSTNARRVRRLSTALALAVVLAIAAMGASLAGQVATASAANWLHAKGSDRQLTFPQLKPKCLQRRIFLGGGEYIWKVFMAHDEHRNNATQASESIRLRTGWFVWKSCAESPWSPTRNVAHTTWLLSERTGRLRELPNSDHVRGNYGNGAYYWGSLLRRPFLR